jgi:Na+-driven multidrug efflux pump
MMTSVVVESGTSSCNPCSWKVCEHGAFMGIKSSAWAHEFQYWGIFLILFIYLFIKNLNFVAKEFQFLLRNVNMMTKI